MLLGRSSGRSQADRRKLFERAAGGGVLPLLYGYCQETGAAAIPEPATEVWRAHLTRQTVYRHQIARVCGLLGDRHLSAVLLKGAPLAVQLYGNDRLRYSADIDLMVPPARVGEAREVLEEAGFEALDERPEPWGTNQLRMQHRKHGAKLELHWRVTRPHVPAPATDRWLEHVVAVSLRGSDMPGLAPPWALMHLCYHFHQDGGGMKALLDVAAWHDRYEDSIRPSEVVEPMRRASGLGILQWPLLALEALTGHRSRLLEASAPSRPSVAMLARSTHRQIERIWMNLDEPSWTEELELEEGAAGTLVELLRQTASLAAVDDWLRHPERLAYPFLFGHHRYGRVLFDCLETVGWVEREALYDRPIFGR